MFNEGGEEFMKKIIISAAAVFSFIAFANSAYAAAPDIADGFVCPVIKTDSVLNSPKGGALGDTGDYTIGGPDVSVPIHATNDNGAGVPAGPHASPGDSNYSAIWGSR
jgi:hypothetical protein